MKIEVKLFASLAKYASHPLILPGGFMDFPATVTVVRILECLNIPMEEIKLVFLNGVHAQMEMEVKDGDRLGIFPPIGGG
jgi:sulfur carrier protein ThiS